MPLSGLSKHEPAAAWANSHGDDLPGFHAFQCGDQVPDIRLNADDRVFVVDGLANVPNFMLDPCLKVWAKGNDAGGVIRHPVAELFLGDDDPAIGRSPIVYGLRLHGGNPCGW